MPAEIKRKKTFGTATIDHFSPPTGETVPPALNIHISFEEALKLHLGLGQLLGHLDGYNRNTKAGRRSAVNLCLYLEKHRITINESRTFSVGGENGSLKLTHSLTHVFSRGVGRGELACRSIILMAALTNRSACSALAQQCWPGKLYDPG